MKPGVRGMFSYRPEFEGRQSVGARRREARAGGLNNRCLAVHLNHNVANVHHRGRRRALGMAIGGGPSAEASAVPLFMFRPKAGADEKQSGAGPSENAGSPRGCSLERSPNPKAGTARADAPPNGRCPFYAQIFQEPWRGSLQAVRRSCGADSVFQRRHLGPSDDATPLAGIGLHLRRWDCCRLAARSDRPRESGSMSHRPA